MSTSEYEPFTYSVSELPKEQGYWEVLYIYIVNVVYFKGVVSDEVMSNSTC